MNTIGNCWKNWLFWTIMDTFWTPEIYLPVFLRREEYIFNFHLHHYSFVSDWTYHIVNTINTIPKPNWLRRGIYEKIQYSIHIVYKWMLDYCQCRSNQRIDSTKAVEICTYYLNSGYGTTAKIYFIRINKLILESEVFILRNFSIMLYCPIPFNHC